MSRDILVTADGWVEAGEKRYRCALGKDGVTHVKAEGDHMTPLGRFPLRRLYYREDRLAEPETGLPTSAIQPNDGWCDAPGDENYNRPVTLPYPASAEEMWREDGLYDVVVVIGHNDDPVIAGHGSAIFMHVATADYAGTEGCVALALPDLLDVVRTLEGESRLIIQRD
jgi:L,D-peptidoglycan transpeptidase YkuD (ErfK/YbiS/YcfS/YnhG family)